MLDFIKKNWLGLVGVLLFLGIILWSTKPESQTIALTYHWSAPVSGPGIGLPAVKYNVYESIDGGSLQFVKTVTDTIASVNAPWDATYRIAVAGVDSKNREGLMSQLSDPFIQETPPPREPGKPVLQ